MPEYVVQFSQPVQYQPDHPRVNQISEILLVHAPTADDAKTHALRVTRGAGEILSVLPASQAPEAVDQVRAETPRPPDPPVAEGFQVMVDPGGPV